MHYPLKLSNMIGKIKRIFGRWQDEPRNVRGDDLRTIIIDKITDDIIEYTDWYAENGVYLPDEFAQDPSAWTEVLRKIQRAFRLAVMEFGSDGEIMKAQILGNQEEVKKLIGGMQEGFELFGKYLNVLRD